MSERREEFRQGWQGLVAGFDEEFVNAFELPTWARDVIHRKVAESQATSELQGGGSSTFYIEWFSQAAGRRPEQGPPPAWCPQPEDPPDSAHWDKMDWALWWLAMGGYRNANEVDVNGWTALHHAADAAKHWEGAYAVCSALMELMDPEWLQAKTTGQRPFGRTALHFLCGSSDRAFKNAHLVEELLDLRADPNCPDSRQATPLHLASASGQLDVVRVLVRKGADLHAVNADGKNAAGVAKLNSRSVLQCPADRKSI
jgi:hypothetical protein